MSQIKTAFLAISLTLGRIFNIKKGQNLSSQQTDLCLKMTQTYGGKQKYFETFQISGDYLLDEVAKGAPITLYATFYFYYKTTSLFSTLHESTCEDDEDLAWL